MLSSQVDAAAALRVRIWYGFIILVVAIFGVRLFYVQVIRYDHFKNAALSDQLRQYEIPAQRGTIAVHDAGSTVPIVLNQKLYTLFADPGYIKDPSAAADKVARAIGGNASDYEKLMRTKDSRYVVLARKLSDDQRKTITGLKLAGVGTQEQDYRYYPQGSMASQLLGFVSGDGKGEYGIEQALNDTLSGTPGELKAITDVNGVPLAASSGNIRKSPVAGDNVLLTLDLGMQQQLETILKQGVTHAKAEAGSAIIIDPHSGAIKAMGNYPTYDPANYANVSNASLFNNAAVSHPIEIGSTMKTLTTAAALDQGVIRPDTTYYDPYHYKVDGFTITNIEEDGVAGTKSIADILNLSLNTGATWELMQMGGGEINQKARNTWHDYLSNHYRFGKATGIEQGYEATGYVPSPKNNGAGINLTYANTAFGQAMTATPVQMAGAESAMLNGGTYYQPHLVDAYTDAGGKTTKVAPKVLAKNVVSPQVSRDMVPLMQYTVEHHYFNRQFNQDKYIVGGKTGTAQIAKPTGGYYDNLYNGTYVGFVGGDTVQYVIVVFIYRPKIAGYAGTAAAQPVFENLAHMLIDNSYASPKSH
ncbi:MAG TPA: penicillin-binding protein 2 [Candidatus Saccharimonadales bacterium]|nr:penicillin-binding protein 2 [Candidatus Saccharimonadales bacterium]